ncbi:hypothetical protein F4780DRAFT_4739 [Xylariomycetidae sp. FL0641]|nr:hypothetical protein F4780DRAFT_4739 [Xylariomycetidae sp. FL0641]
MIGVSCPIFPARLRRSSKSTSPHHPSQPHHLRHRLPTYQLTMDSRPSTDSPPRFSGELGEFGRCPDKILIRPSLDLKRTPAVPTTLAEEPAGSTSASPTYHAAAQPAPAYPGGSQQQRPFAPSLFGGDDPDKQQRQRDRNPRDHAAAVALASPWLWLRAAGLGLALASSGMAARAGPREGTAVALAVFTWLAAAWYGAAVLRGLGVRVHVAGGWRAATATTTTREARALLGSAPDLLVLFVPTLVLAVRCVPRPAARWTHGEYGVAILATAFGLVALELLFGIVALAPLLRPRGRCILCGEEPTCRIRLPLDVEAAAGDRQMTMTTS